MNLNELKVMGYSLIPVNIIGFMLAFEHLGGIVAIAGTGISVGLSFTVVHVLRHRLRMKFINEYELPPIVIKKFKKEYNHLNEEEINLVIKALKQFFMIYSIAVSKGRVPRKGFIMPSRVADELWHNFMLDSENYEIFCKQAFGKMLHHKPGEDNNGNKKLQYLKVFPEELKNTYSHINNLKEYDSFTMMNGVAVLFAIDAFLKIDDGFYYNAQIMQNIHMALDKPSAQSESGASGSCGGMIVAGSGDCSSGGGDGGSCGGGCGGGGD